MTKKTKNPRRPRCRKRAATRPLPQTNSGIDKPAKDSTMEEMTEVCLQIQNLSNRGTIFATSSTISVSVRSTGSLGIETSSHATYTEA